MAGYGINGISRHASRISNLFLIERDVFVTRRAEGIEDAGVFEGFHAVGDIAREVMRIARAEHARIVADIHFHPATDDVDDLFLRMLMWRHDAAGFQFRDHLIHRFAVRYRAPLNSRCELDPWIFVHDVFLNWTFDSFNPPISGF